MRPLFTVGCVCARSFGLSRREIGDRERRFSPDAAKRRRRGGRFWPSSARSHEAKAATERATQRRSEREKSPPSSCARQNSGQTGSASVQCRAALSAVAPPTKRALLSPSSRTAIALSLAKTTGPVDDANVRPAVFRVRIAETPPLPADGVRACVPGSAASIFAL